MVTIKGGSALEKRLSELATQVKRPANLSVGFLENSTYPDGTSVPMIAAIQEFGSKSIPPRPFFRNMVKDKSPTWGDAVANLLKTNDFEATKTMMQVGEGIKGQLEQSIVDTSEPPLSVLTLMIRKWRSDHPNESVTGSIVGDLAAKMHAGPPDVSGVSTKVLVDSGVMLHSIDYTVD